MARPAFRIRKLCRELRPVNGNPHSRNIRCRTANPRSPLENWPPIIVTLESRLISRQPLPLAPAEASAPGDVEASLEPGAALKLAPAADEDELASPLEIEAPAAVEVLSFSFVVLSLSAVVDPEEGVVPAPTALARLAASAAAVGSDVHPEGHGLVCRGAPLVDELVVEPELVENPAAGRSGRRTSTYRAPAELGETSTRASDSHLASERVSLPK